MASPKKKKKKPSLPRKKWSRNPVQKPHSTLKGKKGYARAEDRKKLKDEADEEA